MKYKWFVLKDGGDKNYFEKFINKVVFQNFPCILRMYNFFAQFYLNHTVIKMIVSTTTLRTNFLFLLFLRLWIFHSEIMSSLVISITFRVIFSLHHRTFSLIDSSSTFCSYSRLGYYIMDSGCRLEIHTKIRKQNY